MFTLACPHCGKVCLIVVVGIPLFRRTITVERVTFENSVFCGCKQYGCFLVLQKILHLVRFVFRCGYCSVSLILSHLVITPVRKEQTTIRERQICTCPRCGSKIAQVDSVLLQVFKRSIDNVLRLLMKLKTDINIMNSLCWLATYEKKDSKMNLRFSLF